MKKLFVFLLIFCYLSVIKIIASDKDIVSLELKEFKVILDDENDADIIWSTLDRIESKKFIVEKSVNAIAFFPIDKVLANSRNHIYNSHDKEVDYGASYYRLKHIDDAGLISYSLTLQINKSIPSAFPLVPHEDASNYINLTLEDPGVESIEIIQYATGKKVQDFELDGRQLVQLDVHGLENGQYWLRIKYGRKNQSVRFIKQ